MQNLYPLFERNRILKKELLWSLRDYSFAHIGLEYRQYGQGILKGCHVRIEGEQLVVSPGMIKFRDFVYLITEEERVSYEPTDQVTALKMRFAAAQETPDHILYGMEIVLDERVETGENELEVCRFRLQRGAWLRETYKSFEDMGTQYNVLNYIHASWGSLRGSTMCPVLTQRFAQELLETNGCGDMDAQFAYLCMNRGDALPRDILTDYIGRKNGKKPEHTISQEALFQEMCMTLRYMGGAPQQRVPEKKRRMILVD